MRRPLHLNSSPPSAAPQQGFALFIVLMIMIVIALLVVAASQAYNTEQRISTNDADRKLATSLAEAALRQGENLILQLDGMPVNFADNCVGTLSGNPRSGLCRAPGTAGKGDITLSGDNPTVEAWLRRCGNELCIDSAGIEYRPVTNSVSRTPRYIIEYLNTNDDGTTIYRVTSKAWGKNVNTVVMLQSYVANE